MRHVAFAAAVSVILLLPGRADAQALPDLMARFDGVPRVGEFKTGEYVWMRLAVKNRGTVATPGCVELRVEYPQSYFNNGSVDAGFVSNLCSEGYGCSFKLADVKPRDGHIGLICRFKQLPAGQETSFRFSVYAKNRGGTAMIGTADPFNTIREPREGDNVAVMPVVLGLFR